MDDKFRVIANILPTMASAMLIGISLYGISGWLNNFTKTPKNTNPDYVNPKNIEFKVKDKDFDKQKETYIKVDNKDYLFKMINGVPTCLHYSLEYKINESSGAQK